MWLLCQLTLILSLFIVAVYSNGEGWKTFYDSTRTSETTTVQGQAESVEYEERWSAEPAYCDNQRAEGSKGSSSILCS